MNTFSVNLSAVDENGRLIDGISGTERISGRYFDFSPFIAEIDGYTFVEVQYFGKGISSMSMTSYGSRAVRIEFSDGTESIISGNYSNISLELVYRSESEFSISDRTAFDGRFYAVWGGEAPEGVTYRWYRRIYGTDDPWEEVEAEKCTENEYNLPVRQEIQSYVYDSSQNWINTVYDRISAGTPSDLLLEYTAEAYIGDECIGVSRAVSQRHYGRLMNGSFEYPQVLDHERQWEQFKTGTDGLYWNTTASDRTVELVNTDSVTEYPHNAENAPDGVQFAEILAESSGTLYQDVLSVPNTEMNWQVFHRGRNGTDTMYVIIMSSEDFYRLERTYGISSFSAESYIAGQRVAEYNKFIAPLVNALKNGEYPSAQITEISTGNSEWSFNTGTYRVPENQYVTKFLFMSGNVASNDCTKGNLVDNIKFGYELPDPAPDTSAVTLVKEVSGKDCDGEYTFTLENTDTGETAEIVLSEENGYTANIVVTYGNYLITENTDLADRDGFLFSGVKYSKDGGEPENAMYFTADGENRRISIKAVNYYSMPIPMGVSTENAGGTAIVLLVLFTEYLLWKKVL